jgi:23S rRNA (guanosine2251-2'-O)-methyltransferase
MTQETMADKKWKQPRKPGAKRVYSHNNQTAGKEPYGSPIEFPRPEMFKGLRVILGKNPVIEALKVKGRVQRVYLLPTSLKASPLIQSLTEQQNIPVEEVDKDTLEKMAGSFEHQGVLALAQPFAYTDLDGMLDDIIDRDQQPFLVILDHIEDPHNFGSLIRTADAAGVHGVIIPNKRAAGVTAAVGKSSAGAIEHVPIVMVTNLVQTIKKLQAKGIWVIGADMDGGTLLHQADLSGPIALVVGAEGQGMHRLVKEACDLVVQIPMYGKISSLNVSVAGALLMYEALRQGKGYG